MGGEREYKPERRPLRDWKATVFRFDGEQFCELIEALKSRGGSDLPVLTAIGQLTEKMEEFMATQEERLQAISTKIDEVLALVAELKVNNPQIEDELTEIETKLAGAQPPPPPEP